MRLRWLTGLLLLAAGCSSSAVPERVRAYNDDGLYLFRRGNFREAHDTFQGALDITPDDLSLRYNLAQACEKLGDSGKAEKLYQECIGRDPNNVDSHYALCALQVKQGRREEAARMVEDWLTKQPGRADAYALDGWLWHQAGDLPRAQSRLQQAVQLDPGNVRALTELGLVYESLRYPERALALYERSLDREADQPGVVERVNRLKAQGVSQPRLE